MRYLILLLVSCVGFNLNAQTRNNINSNSYVGSWSDGKQFKVKLFYREDDNRFGKNEMKEMSQELLPLMQAGYVTVKIYSLDENGLESLVTENIDIDRVFDSGNLSGNWLYLAPAENGFDIISRHAMFGDDLLKTSLTVTKLNEQIVVSAFKYRELKQLTLYRSDGETSELGSNPLVSCEINFLSGIQTVNSVVESGHQRVIPFSLWSAKLLYDNKLCSFSSLD